MNTLKLLFGLFSFGLLSISCDTETDTSIVVYDQSVVINEDIFITAPNDDLTIISTKLDEDFLKIVFAASGCNGNSWEVKLIDSGVVFYSNPPQRNLRLSLKDQEPCEAYITKEVTFNVENLQVDGNKVLLNIMNSGDQILYEY